MAPVKGKMNLGLFFRPTGHHEGAWRLPGARPDVSLDLSYWVEVARTIERAKLDFFFLADCDGMRGSYEEVQALCRDPMRTISQFEPLTLMSALASTTSRLGLAATASTTYNEPFHIARKFASIDHLSGGRAAWNVVTSAVDSCAANFSTRPHPAHDARYRVAHEFVGAVKGLWDSYDDDAMVFEKDTGLYFDPRKLHPLSHSGENYSVRGPLNVARPVQGHPVLIQAGASGPGRELAASIADVIFGSANNLDSAKIFYEDVKTRADKMGRDPRHVKVMPGIFLVLGQSSSEAREKYERLQELVHPEVGLSILQALLGFDLSSYALDEPLPLDLPESDRQQAQQKNLIAQAHRDKLTIRQLYLRAVGAHGLLSVVGSIDEAADLMEHWFKQDAADGFNLMPGDMLESFKYMHQALVPELQRRGLFRTEYQGSTLRENLGLPRPSARHRSTEVAA